MCSTHKVIYQKLRRAKVMCGEEFPVGSRVRESDLILAQVRTIYEVVPARTNNKEGEYSACFRICFSVKTTSHLGDVMPH